MDVKTAFLNGVIEEEVYIDKPHGLVIHGKESHVFQLKKVFVRTQADTKGMVL
jgi:hypothetical protein